MQKFLSQIVPQFRTNFLLTKSEEILGDPTFHSLFKSEDDFLHNSNSDVNLDFKWNDPLTHQ